MKIDSKPCVEMTVIKIVLFSRRFVTGLIFSRKCLTWTRNAKDVAIWVMESRIVGIEYVPTQKG